MDASHDLPGDYLDPGAFTLIGDLSTAQLDWLAAFVLDMIESPQANDDGDSNLQTVSTPTKQQEKVTVSALR